MFVVPVFPTVVVVVISLVRSISVSLVVVSSLIVSMVFIASVVTSDVFFYWLLPIWLWWRFVPRFSLQSFILLVFLIIDTGLGHVSLLTNSLLSLVLTLLVLTFSSAYFRVFAFFFLLWFSLCRTVFSNDCFLKIFRFLSEYSWSLREC